VRGPLPALCAMSYHRVWRSFGSACRVVASGVTNTARSLFVALSWCVLGVAVGWPAIWAEQRLWQESFLHKGFPSINGYRRRFVVPIHQLDPVALHAQSTWHTAC